MKKVLIIIGLFYFFPLFVKAGTVNYDIKHYYINANIRENGDLKVSELIVLKGNFKGYIRDILYKNSKLKDNGYENNSIYNANNIEILEVAAKKCNNTDFIDEKNFTILMSDQASNLGYIEKNILDGKSYKIYFEAHNEMVAFKISYILKDVIVAHEDVAEIYWTFIGENYDDRINDLQIRVNLPSKDYTNNFRIWAHGEMTGEIKAIDNQMIEAKVRELPAKSSVDIRSTFDLALINKNILAKKTNDQALKQIIEVETKRADEANQERQKMRIKYYIILGLIIGWLFSLIISWIYVYWKFDREYKKEFKAKYNREFIEEYNVEVIDYLFTKNITSNAMSASIMNLIYKKNIQVEAIEGKKKAYLFTLINKDNLSNAETDLVDFLFNIVGEDNKFTTIELKSYAKSTKTCEKFSSRYQAWKNKVIDESKKQNFYEMHAKPKIIGLIYLVGAIFINVLALVLNVINPFTYIIVFLSIIFLIYTCCFTKRTKRGNEHYAKWLAFKNFLNDFGTFNIKELPEIALWERYMVYATLFGLAKKVSKVMNVKIKDIEKTGEYINYDYMDWYIYDAINTSIVSSIDANTTAITSERVNSISSSGSGFGGGFSSGSGFGGGGGGGRGF